jgi:hypothetical protein
MTIAGIEQARYMAAAKKKDTIKIKVHFAASYQRVRVEPDHAPPFRDCPAPQDASGMF